jgi:electron transport complex protein RnfG
MKTKMMIAAVAAVTLVSGAALAAGKGKGDNVMTKQKDGTYVVNTTTLASNVRGYVGATPLEVYIKKNKVVKVVALPNKETPKIFAKVKSGMLPKYAGKKTSAVSSVDGVTGATYSSKAVKANVEAAVKYYKTHK